MARTWRTERTTPKKSPQQAPVRPRVSEFAEQWYEDHGYTVTAPVGCHTPDDCLRDCACGSALGYLEADA